jgi:hypothetical protein
MHWVGEVFLHCARRENRNVMSLFVRLNFGLGAQKHRERYLSPRQSFWNDVIGKCFVPAVWN